MINTPPFRGFLCFDQACRFCRVWVRRAEPRLLAKGFQVLPLQTPWVRQTVTARGEPLLIRMRVITSDGRWFGGADALLYLARWYWWAFPLRWLALFPPGRFLLRRGYDWVACHRACLGGACVIPPEKHEREPDTHFPTGNRHRRLSAFFGLEDC